LTVILKEISNNVSKIDKAKILAAVVAHFKTEVADILKSAEAAHGGATHEDAVAKSKYDTHALELSYLAGAQYERAAAVNSLVAQYQALTLKPFAETDAIDVTAVVVVENEKGERTHYFIGLPGSGAKVAVEDAVLLLITPQSPLGIELIGLFTGDEVYITRNGKQQLHKITVVY
jgi:transcription elongation GreA/GreB family factor